MAVSAANLRVVAFILLTGLLAVVIIATLLLFGVEPHLVFTPGFIVKSLGKHLGFHVPNWVGVLSTVFVWWIAIVAVRFMVVKVSGRSLRNH